MPERRPAFRPDMPTPENGLESGMSEQERAFFEDVATPLEGVEHEFPFGPEVADEAVIEERQEKARGVLERIRQHPVTKPVFRAMALLMGIGAIGYGSMEKERGESDPELQEITDALADPGVEYEFRKLLFEELLERNQVLNETEARFGRDTWSQGERIEYSEIPTLEGKFEYLHKDNPELIEHYRSPEGRVKSFSGILETMNLEFSHSSLPREFTKTCVQDAPEVFAAMDPQEALELYQEFSRDLAKQMGVVHVRELGVRLAEKLPADHPVNKQMQADGWMSDEVGEWLKSSKENVAIFDQASGKVMIFHEVGNQKALLDVFPGNGGPPDGVAWERGMPAHVAVRTPDGNYTFDRAFEKKSYSWKFSWVVDTAPLRWAEDGENVEYQDVDGKWRLLTGEDAEFTVWGAPEKPFQQKMNSRIYQWSSEKLPDGSWKRPQPFTVKDALGPDGKLRSIWDKNDFGPKSIEIKDEKGKRMTIFFHSSPSDEGAQQFLDYSHGCIHMKPADLEAMAGYLAKGSDIRISSFEEIVSVAQIEKPESESPASAG